MTADPVLTVASGTVVDAFLQRARMTPERAAFHVLNAERTWSPVDWATCAARVRSLAAAFAAAGIGRGDRVAICAGTSLGWELAQMGALFAGASVVGLDPAYPDAELARLFGESGARALVARDAATLARLPSGALRGCRLVATVEDAPGAANPPARALSDLAQTAAPRDAQPQARPDDEALVVYSSGTTGTPKAIAFRHDQLSIALQEILDAFGDIDAQSTLVCWLPLANLFQRMINFAAMARGAASYLVEDPRKVMEHVADANPRVFVGVPRFFEKLRAGIIDRIEAGSRLNGFVARRAIALGDRRARALRSAKRPSFVTRSLWPLADRWVLARIRAAFGANLRYFISGSAPMPLWLLEWFDAIGLPVLEAYGVSENIVPMATNRHGERRLGTVGKPMRVHEVRLADDGEILVRGPGVAAGMQLRDGPGGAGFFATGDLGEFDADGFLRLVGRKADVFKTSTGRWVSPADIEGRLARLPGVEHALVVGAARKAVVALLAIADAKGSAGSRFLADGDANARDRLAEDVDRALADLAPHLHPAGLLIVPAAAFSVAGGELTTNLKLRRPHVERRFATLIESLYRALDRPGSARPTIVAVSGEPPRDASS